MCKYWFNEVICELINNAKHKLQTMVKQIKYDETYIIDATRRRYCDSSYGQVGKNAGIKKATMDIISI